MNEKYEKYLLRIELFIDNTFIACFGATLDENEKIINAAPMGKWWLGKKLSVIKEYYNKTKYTGTYITIIKLNKLSQKALF